MSQSTILVADNDKTNLSALAETLHGAGYVVLTASSAEEAIRLGEESPPDLAILDMSMLGAFGIDTAKQLREQAGIDTIFLTSHHDKDFVELAIKDGALGYLIKPITSQQLLPSIQSALECSSELRRLQLNQDKLSEAIQRNREISVAIGIYMERFSTSEQEAFETLRSFARNERRKLVEIARELIQVTEGKNQLINRIHNNNST